MILKPILKFLKAWLHIFCCSQDVLSQCINMHKIICCDLSQHCTAPSPCPSFSSDHTDRTLMFGGYWAVGACLGLGSASHQGRATAMTCLKCEICFNPHQWVAPVVIQFSSSLSWREREYNAERKLFSHFGISGHMSPFFHLLISFRDCREINPIRSVTACN